MHITATWRHVDIVAASDVTAWPCADYRPFCVVLVAVRRLYNAYSSHLLAHLLVYSMLVIKRMFLWYWLLNWLLRNNSIIWLPTKTSQCTNLQKNLELLQPTKTFRPIQGQITD